MRVLRVSAKAEDELADIVAGLSDFSEEAALRLRDEVVKKYNTLLQFPNMGPAVDHIKPGWRFFPVQSRYLIFYKVTEEAIEILHVVHGMRDLVNLFADEEA